MTLQPFFMELFLVVCENSLSLFAFEMSHIEQTQVFCPWYCHSDSIEQDVLSSSPIQSNTRTLQYLLMRVCAGFQSLF